LLHADQRVAYAAQAGRGESLAPVTQTGELRIEWRRWNVQQGVLGAALQNAIRIALGGTP
jgi:hypothetical protein